MYSVHYNLLYMMINKEYLRRNVSEMSQKHCLIILKFYRATTIPIPNKKMAE